MTNVKLTITLLNMNGPIWTRAVLNGDKDAYEIDLLLKAMDQLYI